MRLSPLLAALVIGPVTTPALAQRVPLRASPQYTLVGHSAAGRAVTFSPNGALLASASSDGRLQLWRTADGAPVRTILVPDGVTTVAFTPDGQTVVTGGYGGRVHLWSTVDGALRRTLTPHAATVWSVAVSPDGARIASAGEDRVIRLSRASDGALLHVLRGHTLNIWSVAFSPDGRTVASGSFDHSVRLWSAEAGTLQRTLTGHTQAVVGVAFSPDGRTLASGGDDSAVRLWSVADGRLVRTIDAENHVYKLAFTPDGASLVSGGRARGPVGTLVTQAGGIRFAGQATGLKLWSLPDGALRQTVTGHTDDVTDVAIAPDGRRMATASEDRTIRLWRLGGPPPSAAR